MAKKQFTFKIAVSGGTNDAIQMALDVNRLRHRGFLWARKYAAFCKRFFSVIDIDQVGTCSPGFPAFSSISLSREQDGHAQRRLGKTPPDLASCPYLNILEKLNCACCSYANGIIAFVREVAGRTEQHWCPIKNTRHILAAHPNDAEFVDHGDTGAYRRLLGTAKETSSSQAQTKPQLDPASR